MTIWLGNWWSEQYFPFFVKGTIWTNLPDDIKSLNNSEIDIQITYTGIYRKGAVENLKSIASYNDGKINMTVDYNYGLLSYSVIMIGNTMKGKYLLTNPQDRGSLQLTTQEHNLQQSNCTLL